MNIRCFCFLDSLPPVSHALVLPQDPNSAPPPGTTPSVLPDTSQDDALGTFFEMTPGAGVGEFFNMFMCVGWYAQCMWEGVTQQM